MSVAPYSAYAEAWFSTYRCQSISILLEINLNFLFWNYRKQYDLAGKTKQGNINFCQRCFMKLGRKF